MRDYLRDVHEVQTAAYLSQVINDVVPLEDDVSLYLSGDISSPNTYVKTRVCVHAAPCDRGCIQIWLALTRSWNGQVVNNESVTEQQEHRCVYPNGDVYDGSFLVDKFRPIGPANYRLERRHGDGVYTEADGSRYEGNWKTGVRHGQGVQWWALSGDEYQGEWQNDRRHGQGRHCCADGRVYSGSWAEDREEGRGRLVDADNSAFEGNFLRGRFHGPGTKVWPNGQRYKGEWKDGKKHGRGILSCPDGSFYKGEFVEDQMRGVGLLQHAAGGVCYHGEFSENLPHGKGKQWQDESISRGGVYDGEWASGLKHGFGQYTGPDGTVYEGEYRQDVKCGTGTLRWPDGQVYTGMFLNGKRHGAGKTTWPNGDVFEGIYTAGVKHGLGAFSAASGERHEGQYEEDTPHGLGRFSAPGGHSFEGKWERGKRHGTGTEFRNGSRTRTVYEHGLLLSVTPTAPGPEDPHGRLGAPRSACSLAALLYGRAAAPSFPSWL